MQDQTKELKNNPSNSSGNGEQGIQSSQFANPADGYRRTLKTLFGLSPSRNPGPEGTTGSRRLGRAALGPHAFEQRMPTRLRAQLESVSTGNEQDSSGVIKVLGRLCAQDESTDAVYLCHPTVRRISKSNREGNLCGYRNIQMMISYIIGIESHGFEHFPEGIPSILDLQDLIEEAWDKGINIEGREETGGIRGTRKYIGTPETQALLRGLGIGCRAGTYHDDTPNGSLAWESLLEFVRQYFLSSSPNATTTPGKVRQTHLPPIYLQRPRHSVTIVGFETRTDGTSNLLVFDPAFRLSDGMEKALRSPSELGTTFALESKQARKLLDPFRRGRRQLQRYKRFETLMLT